MWLILLSVWAESKYAHVTASIRHVVSINFVCFKNCSVEKIVALTTSAPEPQKGNVAIVTYQKWKTNVDQKVPDSHMVGRTVSETSVSSK